MNINMWNLYKDSERGRQAIDTFSYDKEDFYGSIERLLEYFNSKKYEPVKIESTLDAIEVFDLNILYRDYFNEDNNRSREEFEKFITELYLVYAYYEDETIFCNEDKMIIKANDYRSKASSLHLLSMILYSFDEFYKPIFYRGRFDIIQNACDTLGILLPSLPHTNDYKGYLMYYYDICEVFEEFQIKYNLSPSEFCACLYDFSELIQDERQPTELPKPTNVWFTGASKADYKYLDNLGAIEGKKNSSVWACNERTKSGDIVVMYCTSPRSYIHSIWRAASNGVLCPFDYYHSRSVICNGVRVPEITINDLKTDVYFSELPIVRRNLQGLNGVELSAKDYSELLRLIGEKGGNVEILPKLFEGELRDFGEITLEKDVEEKILIPMLIKLGYQESDWSRQLTQKAGRGLKAIPDFVFFPRGERHFETAPLVIEAKLDMSLMTEQHNAFTQGLSYARLMRSSLLGICDKKRFLIYKLDENGITDRNNPIFEEHWTSIYEDSVVGARLNQLIGRDVIKEM